MFRQTAFFPLWYPIFSNFIAHSASYGTLGAANRYSGGQFFCIKDATISNVIFRTGNASSPVLTIRAEINTLDSSGFPIGGVLANSSGVVNPSANTLYNESLSYSITAGNWYGIRIVVSSYTSGSINVALSSTTYMPLAGNQILMPCGVRNTTGTDVKITGNTHITIKTTDGLIPCTIGTSIFGDYADITTSSTIGDVYGNKFTLNKRVKIFGYLAGYYNASDNNASVELYSGSDNTAISGSTSTLKANYQVGSTGVANYVCPLTTPLILDPGTYRVGIKLTAASTSKVGSVTSFFEANPLYFHTKDCTGIQKTIYTSGAWTDTSTDIASCVPIVDSVYDGLPDPIFQLGI